jgi:hypothetical protein
MAILLIFAALLLVIFLIFLLVGYLTQEEQSLSRNIFIKAPLDEIWMLVTDIVRHIEWRDNLQKIEIKDDNEEQMVWVEIPKKGQAISYKLIDLKHHSLFEAEVISKSIYTGSVKIDFTSSRAGVTLRITEKIAVKHILRRPFSNMWQKLESHANQYQDNLKRYFDTPALERQKQHIPSPKVEEIEEKLATAE